MNIARVVTAATYLDLNKNGPRPHLLQFLLNLSAPCTCTDCTGPLLHLAFGWAPLRVAFWLGPTPAVSISDTYVATRLLAQRLMLPRSTQKQCVTLSALHSGSRPSGVHTSLASAFAGFEDGIPVFQPNCLLNNCLSKKAS